MGFVEVLPATEEKVWEDYLLLKPYMCLAAWNYSEKSDEICIADVQGYFQLWLSLELQRWQGTLSFGDTVYLISKAFQAFLSLCVMFAVAVRKDWC